MFDNAKVILGNVLSTVKVKINAMSRPIKTVIVGYFLLVVVLVATYYIAWLYQWHNGQIVMSDLLAVIKEMIGPATKKSRPIVPSRVNRCFSFTRYPSPVCNAD